MKNNSTMRIFIPLFILLLFALKMAVSQEQTSAEVDNDQRISTGISKSVLQLIEDRAENFSRIKGNLVVETVDGYEYFEVKGMDEMQSNYQRIVIKKGAQPYYLADYEGDAKLNGICFAAFTGGISTLTNSDSKYSIGQVKERTTDLIAVYGLFQQGKEVASIELQPSKTMCRIIVGQQPQ